MDSSKCNTSESETTVSVSLEIGLGCFPTPQQLREWLWSSGVKDEIVQAIPEPTLLALCHYKVRAKLKLLMRREPTPVTYVSVELPSSIPTGTGPSAPTMEELGSTPLPSDVHRFRL